MSCGVLRTRAWWRNGDARNRDAAGPLAATAVRTELCMRRRRGAKGTPVEGLNQTLELGTSNARRNPVSFPLRVARVQRAPSGPALATAFARIPRSTLEPEQRPTNEANLNIRSIDGAHDSVAQLCHHRSRRPGWRKQAIPVIRHCIWKSLFVEGRNLGQGTVSSRGRDAQRLQGPAFDLGQNYRRIGKQRRNLPAESVSAGAAPRYGTCRNFTPAAD